MMMFRVFRIVLNQHVSYLIFMVTVHVHVGRNAKGNIEECCHV